MRKLNTEAKKKKNTDTFPFFFLPALFAVQWIIQHMLSEWILQRMAVCSVSESQLQNRIMRPKFWPVCVGSNTVKETENPFGKISEIRKRKEWLSVGAEASSSHLSV